MATRKDVLDALGDFKVARDALLHADDNEFIHQLRLFLQLIDTNPLCKQVIKAMPAFDSEAWWKSQTEGQRRPRESLDLPESKAARLSIFLGLARSFASQNGTPVSVKGFGRLFGKHKHADSLSLAQSIVIRPLAEELTTRIRDASALANPDLRDLAGVPLSRIPSENELGIFLSHKTENKDVVRRYHRALQELGFKPWFDEEAIPAGGVLHRALDHGMGGSCAAVFFVTSAFKDERWIGKEVDLAVHRKVELGDKFQIITLVFEGATVVPKPLQNYVYKHVASELDGLWEILRGLPIELGPARWKERVVA